MAMVRISDKALERLKELAVAGNRPLTNQLDELLLKEVVHQPVSVGYFDEPSVADKMANMKPEDVPESWRDVKVPVADPSE